MTAGWGPQHASALPGGLRLGKPGGYWRGIAVAAVVMLFFLIGKHGEPGWTATTGLVMAGVGVAAGVRDVRTGDGFACGRWLAFLVTAVLSVPCGLAYTGTYFWRRSAPQRSAARNARRAAQFEAAHQAQAAADPAAAPDQQPWPSLPGGFFGVDDAGRPVCANPRGASLVIGPPGSGKTSCVIENSVAYAPAACVSTSIKAEVMTATAAIRAQRGTCWWFDPGGAGGDSTPPGVERLRWNPLCDVRDWPAAISVAARMTGPLRPPDGGTGDHWLDRAETWLSVMLFAASLGSGLERFAEWCRAPIAAAADVEAVLMEAATLDNDRGAHFAMSALSGILATEDKERSAIASTLSRITRLYNNPAAIDAGSDPNFDPAKFVRSSDTVYITAPSSAQADYAPLIVGLLESIRAAQEARRQRVDMGQETQDAPITFVLDEASNTAPIPLPQIASAAGGQGLHLVVAVQEPNQVRQRWGTAGEGFLTLFPDKLILSGMADERWCTMLSKMSGEYDRMTTSLNAGSKSRQDSIGLLFNTPTAISTNAPSVSYQTQRTPQLSVADISGIPFGRALYFSRNGWQLIHARVFNPAMPITTTGGGSGRANRPAPRIHLPSGMPGWLATPKRLTVATAGVAALLLAAFVIIPALSGGDSSGSGTGSTGRPTWPTAAAAPPYSSGAPAAYTQPYWDGARLRGYWTSPSDDRCDADHALWVVEDTAVGRYGTLYSRCFRSDWIAEINLRASTFEWGISYGTIALLDQQGVFKEYGRVGDLTLVRIEWNCQDPNDDQLRSGPIPLQCIYEAL